MVLMMEDEVRKGGRESQRGVAQSVEWRHLCLPLKKRL